MTYKQLEKLKHTLADFYKVVYWGDPFNADEFFKKKIESLGGQVKPLSESPLTSITGWHQDESGIHIVHTSHAFCTLSEDLANKILVLGLS